MCTRPSQPRAQDHSGHWPPRSTARELEAKVFLSKVALSYHENDSRISHGLQYVAVFAKVISLPK